MPHFRPALDSVLVAAFLAAWCAAARGATPLAALRYASDITVQLSGTTLTPGEIGEDDLAGMVTTVDVGALPPDLHIDAYHLLPNGDQLLSFDTAVELPGGDIADPADVVRVVGSAFVIVFDASERGIPAGVNVDAVAMVGNDLLLSFDVAVRLDDTTFEDEDLVRFTGMVPPFLPYFDGSSAGVSEDLDLDGAQVLSDSRMLASFDGSGVLNGTAFDDDDVLEYDSDTDTWELVYDGSANHAGWQDGDLVALYALVAGTPTPTPTSVATGAATQTATATTAPTGPTATRTAVPTGIATATATAPSGECVGDCDGDGEVEINELITMVNISLGFLPVTNCPAGDPSGNGAITIEELIQAVNNALSGC